MNQLITYEIIDSKLHKVKLLDQDVVSEEIEAIVSDFDLIISEKTTLSTKKGSVHWHIKKQDETGVLEITYWPKKSRLWIDIHNNRRKEWNLGVIEPMANRFSQEFGGRVENISK
ncbi:hypothetical protein ACGTN9_11935 [Halobacillus sp. MO56]